MMDGLAWLSAGASALLILGYELSFARSVRRDPSASARSLHRLLRAAWVQALSKQPGSELLAVQALRNSLMSATITASTAALVLMGSVSLIVARERQGTSGFTPVSLGLALEIALVLVLFAAYVCSAMAMRFYHHAGFVLSLPVGAAERMEREPLASIYVQQAGVLYSWSLRCFLFAAPIAVGMLNPLAMPLAALGLIAVLARFDRVPSPP